MNKPRDPEIEVVRLQCIIADALAAMDECRYGDARRFLKTGAAKAIIPLTSIAVRNG